MTKRCSKQSASRRDFLKRSGAAFLAGATFPGYSPALQQKPSSRVSREVFLAAPGKGTAVMAFAYYTRKSGLDMMSIEQRWSRSDTIDVSYYRYSTDNGRTWSDPEERATGEKRPDGMLRRHLRGGYVDPRTGRFLEFWNEGLLPSDDPLEGMRRWNIFYTVSEKGDRDNGAAQQIVHQGNEFDATHPLPGVYTGKNCVMLGDSTCRPITMKDGSILVPVQITPLGPDGRYHNPGGGYTYTEAAVLHGRWQGRVLMWRMSDRVKGDPQLSTRGMVEPSIAALDNGRLLMVMRGSNDQKFDLPSHRWVSYSTDGGWKWSTPEPWTYDNGKAFFSPSSCSQLLRHSGGKLFWIGNINQNNPRGNRPRYPLYLGQVDSRSGVLVRESLIVVDDRQTGEDEILTLSNFYAREDRETRQIVIHMTRMFAFPDGWVGDAQIYRVSV